MTGEQGPVGEQGPRGKPGHLFGARQKLALAFVVIGCLGLTGAIIGIADLASKVGHQGTKIEAQQGAIVRQQNEIEGLVGALAANVHAQVSNRTANVLTWCGSINADRNYQRQRVKMSAAANPGLHLTPYVLPDLPCPQLAMQTAKSDQHHPANSATGSTAPSH